MLTAVKNGDAKELAELMRHYLGFDVNMVVDEDGYTLLHYACSENSRSSVIPLLMAHPDIDLNVKEVNGWTPFYIACSGHTSCVGEMLKDSRVKLNERSHSGRTPLFWAARCGCLGVIKTWIASGREIDLGKPGDVDKTDAIGGAKKYGNTETASLLERFKENPVGTIHVARVELGWYDELAAKMFAMVIFVSDGLLQTKDTTPPSPAATFFSVVKLLPLELQMLICYKAVGSNKEIILSTFSEIAFRHLVNEL